MNAITESELKVPFIRRLAPDGTLVGGAPLDIEAGQLRSLYEAMLFARRADERMLKLQRQGRIGTFPPCTGQEAAAVGPVAALQASDWFVGAFRELGGHLLRGVPLLRVLQYYAGWEEGAAYPIEDRNLPISIILASQLPHAVGLAYAMRYQGEDQTAVLAFVGDGGSSEGDFHEALNLAAVWRLPVVFVIQNNGWAISVPRSAQTASRTLAQKALAYGMPGVQVDGNDALATYQVTRDALVRARAGEGPTLIEAVTYRLLMHTTADDPGKYRDPAEVEPWAARDPLTRLRTLLIGRGLLDAAAEQALEQTLKARIDESVRQLEAWRDRSPELPFEHVYGTPDPALVQQREELRQRLQAAEVHHA